MLQVAQAGNPVIGPEPAARLLPALAAAGLVALLPRSCQVPGLFLQVVAKEGGGLSEAGQAGWALCQVCHQGVVGWAQALGSAVLT